MVKKIGRPQLVTLEGDGALDSYADMLGMDIEDVELLGCGSPSVSDMRYLNNKYPEYMGIWGAILKGVGKALTWAPAAIKRAASGRRRKKQNAANKAAAEKQAILNQQMAMQRAAYAAQEKKKQQTKMMLMMGVPVALMAVMMVTRKK